MVKLLLDYGANTSSVYIYEEYRSKITVPILTMAAQVGKLKMIELLRNAGASINEMCYAEKNGEPYGNWPLKKCD